MEEAEYTADAFTDWMQYHASGGQIGAVNRGLLPHQKERLDALFERSGIIADEQGSGKTLTAVTAALIAATRGLTMLIIIPVAAAAAFEHELARVKKARVDMPGSTPRPPLQIQRVRSNNKSARANDLSSNICMVTHQWLQNAWSNLQSKKHISKACYMSIFHRKWDMVVVDEAHLARNPTTGLYKALRDIRACTSIMWLMTGTPANAYTKRDLAALTTLVTRRVVAEDDAQKAYAEIAMRILTKDITNLPPCTRHVVYIELDASSRARYDAECVRETPNPANQGARIQAALGKIEAASHLAERGTVIFCEWLTVLNRLHAHLLETRSDLRVGTYTGDCSEGQRIDVVRRANAGEVDVLLITAAGSVAINLQDAFWRVIFVTLSYAPAVHLQTISRVHRKGQLRDVEVIFVVAKDTIEMNIIDILLAREKDATAAANTACRK